MIGLKNKPVIIIQYKLVEEEDKKLYKLQVITFIKLIYLLVN